MRPEEVLHNDISLMRYPVACRAKLPRRGYTCWKGDLTSVVLTTRSRKIEYHFPPLELRSQNGQDRDLTSLWTRASRSSGLRFRKRRDPPAALPQQPCPSHRRSRPNHSCGTVAARAGGVGGFDFLRRCLAAASGRPSSAYAGGRSAKSAPSSPYRR